MELVLPLQQARRRGRQRNRSLPSGAAHRWADPAGRARRRGLAAGARRSRATPCSGSRSWPPARMPPAHGPTCRSPAAAGDPGPRRWASGATSPRPSPSASVHDTTVELNGEGQSGSVFGSGRQAPAAVVELPPELDRRLRAMPVPVVANRALLDSLEAVQGDTLTADLAGRIRRVHDHRRRRDASRRPIRPSAPPHRRADARLSFASAARAARGVPDEWWLSAANGDVDRLAQDLRGRSLGTRRGDDGPRPDAYPQHGPGRARDHRRADAGLRRDGPVRDRRAHGQHRGRRAPAADGVRAAAGARAVRPAAGQLALAGERQPRASSASSPGRRSAS